MRIWHARKIAFPRSFYERPALQVARALLGHHLVHDDGAIRRVGRIVETEAYIGPQDLACHASKGRTRRTEVMFGPAGHAYVYLIYGMYNCFNVVTGRIGHPAAVLVRAVSPVQGCDGATNGPGKLCRAMAITRTQNGVELVGSPLRIEEGTVVPARRVARGPRVGIDYAGAWVDVPYRLWLQGDPHVSHPR